MDLYHRDGKRTGSMPRVCIIYYHSWACLEFGQEADDLSRQEVRLRCLGVVRIMGRREMNERGIRRHSVRAARCLLIRMDKDTDNSNHNRRRTMAEASLFDFCKGTF
jgi:hypothetical protein